MDSTISVLERLHSTYAKDSIQAQKLSELKPQIRMVENELETLFSNMDHLEYFIVIVAWIINSPNQEAFNRNLTKIPELASKSEILIPLYEQCRRDPLCGNAIVELQHRCIGARLISLTNFVYAKQQALLFAKNNYDKANGSELMQRSEQEEKEASQMYDHTESFLLKFRIEHA